MCCSDMIMSNEMIDKKIVSSLQILTITASLFKPVDLQTLHTGLTKKHLGSVFKP